MANLNAVRLENAPVEMIRPLIIWETPFRGRGNRLNAYAYAVKATQYGCMYLSTTEQLGNYQDLLLGSLEEAHNALPVFGLVDDGNGGLIEQELTKLKNVDLVFENSTTLNVPFYVKYEIMYTKTRPDLVPAIKVTTTISGITGVDGSDSRLENDPGKNERLERFTIREEV